MDKPADKTSIRELGAKWIDKIRAAGVREAEKAFLEDAAKAEAIYRGEVKNGAHRYTFNVLHSNIETIVPACYSATPKPDIRRRFNDRDPVAKGAADMLERAITVQIDDGALDGEMEGLAQMAFAAGRGIIRIRLVEEDAATGAIDDDVQETATETAVNEAGESSPSVEEPEAEEAADPLEPPKVQRIVYEAVNWKDFRFGPAKRWQDVPWLAFRHMIPEETIKEWSEDEGVQTQLRALPPATIDGSEDSKGDVAVWEVWARDGKTVRFIRESDGIIYKAVRDPLGLAGFFPVCRPVQPIEVVGDLSAVPPFRLYEDLARELDDVTARLRKLIKGCKVRGAAASGEMMQGVADLAGADDNEIVEWRGVEALAQQGGLDKGITWWPIEKSIEAIQALAQHREMIKATIYEVTGISDIVRGASNAQETATAQQIKSQWGSLRIQKMQRLIERAVRELFVMSAELVATKFTPQTLTAITGLEYTPEIDAIFKNRVDRFYRIDVETDSTIKADLTKNKGEMTEFLAGTAQYIQSIGPAVQAGIMPAQLAVEIFASFARIFRLGKQTEDALSQMGDMAKQADEAAKNGPAPLPPELQQQIEGMQQELAKLTEENQALKADKSAEAEKLAMDREKHDLTMQQTRDKHGLDMDMARQKAAQAQNAKPAVAIGADAEAIGTALSQFGEMMLQRIEQGDQALMKAVMAPREVKAVRGPDGKMQGAISTPVVVN